MPAFLPPQAARLQPTEAVAEAPASRRLRRQRPVGNRNRQKEMI